MVKRRPVEVQQPYTCSRRVSEFFAFSLTETTRTLPSAASSDAPSRVQLGAAACAGAATASRARTEVSTARGRFIRLMLTASRPHPLHPEVVDTSTCGRRPRHRQRAHPDARSRRGRSRARSRSGQGRSWRSARTSATSATRAPRSSTRGGAALVPGLVDSHLHPFWGAELARGVDLGRARTQVEVLAALTAGEPERGWLFAWGLDYNAAPTPRQIGRGRPRRGRLRPPVGPAHRARHAARARAGPGDRPARLPGRLRGGVRERRPHRRAARDRRAGPRAARRAAAALARAARAATSRSSSA